MRRIVFLAILLLGETWSAEHNAWRRAGDVRFERSGTVIAVSSLSIIFCSATCTRIESCLSFNYHSADLQCELLNDAPSSLTSSELVAESGWSFYFLDVPVPDPCYNSSCAVTAMCLRYDQPLKLLPYDPSLYKHTCSDRTYFLHHRKAGRTDCLFKLHYEMEFYGFNTGLSAAPEPYHESLAKCLQYNCLTMVCFGATGCYLKASSPDLNPELYYANTRTNTWIPVCYKG